MNKDVKQLAENYLAMPGGMWNPFSSEMHPDVVEEDRIPNPNYGKSKSSEDYLTVQYEKIVPLLIEGIKEQQEQIEELREEIKQLKNG